MRGFDIRRGALLAMVAGAMSVPVAAVAQEEDDWEFGEDAARELTAATVRYDAGKAVVVQCEKGDLKVVIVGLPATTTASRRLAVSRADGRSDVQTWFAPAGQTAFTSTVSGRDARFLRGGGLYQLRSAEGEAGTPMRAAFDLPTQNANLDRVLTACGYAVSDERDLLQRASPDLKTAWEAEHENDRPRVRSGSRSVSQPNSRARQGPSPSPGPETPRQTDTNCIVRNGTYSDCRFDYAPDSRRVPNPSEIATRMNGVRLEPVSAAANEGRVEYIGVLNAPLIVVQRYEPLN